MRKGPRLQMESGAFPFRRQVITSSRDVSAYFGKQHGHVLRDIDALLAQAPVIAPNFGAVDYRDAKGETRRAFDMTRDGFMLLAMGFTGAKATALKLAYIERFNAMEAALLSQQPARIELGVDFANGTLAASVGAPRRLRNRTFHAYARD